MTKHQEAFVDRIRQANFPGPNRPTLKDFENYLRKRDKLSQIDKKLGTLYEECFVNCRYDLGQELYKEFCMTKIDVVSTVSLGSKSQRGFPSTPPTR